jgi:DNA repair exonuclease SbcCD ATPase subunit
MIPQRIRLKGFLCYKDEQEISFHDKSLWMLAGSNGSGKSSIFDALTYVLFGYHRGGSQHAGELINKDADRMSVEFEFLLDGQHYRARRTLQRNSRGTVSGTQMISRRVSGQGNGHASWDPLEDTSRKANFDAWVRENIGLNYETFTSSVLLLQGKAERLIDSTAKGRFEVLAGIVDLEHYERLHKRADEQRKRDQETVERYKAQLDMVPEVDDGALLEAAERIATAEAARQQAEAEVERVQRLESQAREWARLQGQLEAARQKWQQAQALLADAAAIEQGLARLQELRDVLPHIQVVLEQRSQIEQSEAKSAALTKDRQQQDDERVAVEDALEQSRRKRTALHKATQADEQRRQQVQARFREVAVLLEKVKEYERQKNDLARLQAELARLPADSAEAVRQAREACDGLAAVAQAVTLLTRLHGQREELRAARARDAAAEQARQAVQSRGEQARAEEDRLRPQAEEAGRARQVADDQTTRARTLMEQAAAQHEEVTELEGAKVCRHCGQPLSPGHVEEEKRRRKQEVTRTKEEFQQAVTAQRAAARRERELREQCEAVAKKLQEAREEFLNHRHQADQAQQDAERLRRECGVTYAELAEGFRLKVSRELPADWLPTVYPTAGELAALRQQAAGLAGARQRLLQAEEAHEQRSKLTAQAAAVEQSLARLKAELPGDPEQVRQEHVRLEAEEQALDRGLAARRAEAADIEKQLEHLGGQRERAQHALAQLDAKLQTEERSRRHCQEALARALKLLPAAWREQAAAAGLARLEGWHQEREALVAQQIEERGRQLQQARVGLEMLRRDVDALEGQQGQLPEQARQDPVRLQEAVQQARQAQRARDAELSQAQQQKLLLDGYRQQRQQLREEILLAEKEHSYSKQLAELLGRDRLQLHLVRQAERQVVDHANAVLDRLSGGQLYLRLVGSAEGEGNNAKALELEAYNRVTGERPINVAFLSGSQKFRVAVSLALGIGQYASRRHRPIESVIIDEGFGCLDKDGRQVMIQELQNLRGHLQCILLVSHQEEFASAFSDGYRFELKEGATRVSRFQQ